ncbi:outer membrane efflux protein [Bacteroides coprosuis DSM 18011]|uniref:Outer membrane efflux protein n=1 Tax=Bacteroides coprosuis DSM 18011 TaxID=679937 RepID=F3ZP54_9BACE|nr:MULTISPECIES: TolC family protein [Bacteroides]EGJ70281.1 outer membrane efflux protein [Bacteroides coprosuis DSM 18011]HJD93304.1 TolC family protein [Bacteroides coprosuis]
MKRYIIFALSLCTASLAFAQSDLQVILKQIEANNPEIQANQKLMEAQVWDTKSSNNLDNPTVSYAHVWDSKNKSETESELEITQGFEFPTAYIHRNKVNKRKIKALEATFLSQRQNILLQAKEVCLDLIMLHQQKTILDQRLNYADKLYEAYQKMLEAGDATSIEVNKIKLEKLNIQTESTINASELKKKEAELVTLNGNKPISILHSEYPSIDLPDYNLIKDEAFDSSFDIQYARSEYEAAVKQIAVNKAGWFPHLELGYKRNSGTGHHANGLVVGFSIPLFNNRGKVSSAKANAISKAFSEDLVKNKLQSEIYQSYEEAKAMKEQIDSYEKTLDIEGALSLLEKALQGGELSMTAYFVEIATVYQSAQNLIQIQNMYQKQIAKLYKHRL